MARIISTTTPNGIFLLPQNLAKLGVKRRGDGIEPDLQTPWLSSYPVIKTYISFCKAVSWKPFGGGHIHQQGNQIGQINSGYRDKPIGGNENSEHMFALPLDVYSGGASNQLLALPEACHFYSRVGVYPERKFMHLGLAPDESIRKYNKAKYWIKTNKYKLFDNPADMISYLKAEYGI